MDTEDAAEIARQNDAFRRETSAIMLTRGVEVLSDVCGLIEEVRRFDKFTGANDPHGEHDFGQIAWDGEKVFWKIDYYDEALRYGEDPLSQKCHRMLIVMLAGEY